jgi:phenylalanyl-tRNA synthetase beta chain
MTILTLNKKELEKNLGKLTEELRKKIDMFGTPIDGENEEELMVEVFPNRPDLLSAPNFVKAISQFIGKKKPTKIKASAPKKDYRVIIDKSVKEVRPFTSCAIVSGLRLNDQKIKEIIDIQEKLHLTIGRKRRKLAIGIYPLEKIKLPITFQAKKPNDIKFRPLEFPREVNGAQILRQHPTGREYGDLLKDAEVYPIFTDAEGKVLSMPPIINSHETGKVSEKTKAVFIECSGFNKDYLDKTLNIIVTSLAEMGGKVYGMEIVDKKEKYKTPNLTPQKMKFKLKDINDTLGLELSEKDARKHLEKMGIEIEKGKDKNLLAIIPPERTDILHWIDLTEEIAIPYGYDNFDAIIPDISTIGEESSKSKQKKVFGQIIAGQEYLECSSFHLVNKKDTKKIYFESKDFIELEDSKTEYNALRMDLLTNLLKILSENSNCQYPQKLFEIGTIFEKEHEGKTEFGITEKENLAIVNCHEKTNFTDIKQTLDYFMKMIDKDYNLLDAEHPAFIPGRCGKIIVDKKEIGFIGEIAPRVLKNWKIGLPVSAMEINIDNL